MPTSQNENHSRGTLTLLRDLVPRRRLTAREALQVADIQAGRLRRSLGVDGPVFPTEALDLPRLQIHYDADLPSSGMTFWNGSSWIIVLNANEAPTRRRFSLLHEFKHIVDHTTKHHLYGRHARRHDPAAERAADYFAACVLMPKLYVKRHWGQGPRNLLALARTFEVSPAAMRYRLDQLGLTTDPRRCAWSPNTYRRVLPRTLELAA